MLILVLSPKILPPLFSELGSIVSTATLCPLLQIIVPKASINVLFPTPGLPVIPILILSSFGLEIPERTLLAITLWSVFKLSIRVMALLKIFLSPF